MLSEEPGRLENYFTEYFDKILIDAPCSGEGMFRKDKKMVKAWEEHGPEFFSNLQRNIILQAARMLKPAVSCCIRRVHLIQVKMRESLNT